MRVAFESDELRLIHGVDDERLGAEKAERLRMEHQELYSEFSELVDRAEKMFFAGQTAALAVWVGPQFLDFDARLSDHEQRENELIYDAFDSDIGVGD